VLAIFHLSGILSGMIAILESPDVRSRALPISVETYHWMIGNGLVEQRTELIRGVIVEKMSKSSLHEFLATEIRERLASALGDGWLVRKEGPVTLRDSEPEPDVSVVRGCNADFIHSHPRTVALAVEIAVTSETSDREMIKAYAEAGIAESWLVLPAKKVIECYSNPREGDWQDVRRLGMEDTLVSTALPGVSISVTSLFPPTAPGAGA
jgi:Uma2 family endonuclease